MIDRCIVAPGSAVEMRQSGFSLARTLYRKPLTIILCGELGAGKTTLVQGLAGGLRISENIISPTFALEQRYGEKLCHIDLFRVSSPQDARSILEQSENFPGVRAIEWPERVAANLEPGIEITVTDRGTSGRTVDCAFRDIPIPTDRQIAGWMDEVLLPTKVRLHSEAVAENCDRISSALTRSGVIVRIRALHAAAKVHDLLRFVDFNEKARTVETSPTAKQIDRWNEMKKEYGVHHEEAAAHFLSAHGYREIGEIVRVHKGWMPDGSIVLSTIEQSILTYADKRTLIDRTVTIDERFDDFIERYGNGVESERAKVWRQKMKDVERQLFPNDVPF